MSATCSDVEFPSGSRCQIPGLAVTSDVPINAARDCLSKCSERRLVPSTDRRWQWGGRGVGEVVKQLFRPPLLG